MALLIPDADYTDRDFDSLRARLIELLLSVFPNADTESATFTMLLLELEAFVGDRLSAYLDWKARERFTQTAQLRQSMIDLAQHVGYRLAGATAATAEVVISAASVALADIDLPAGIILRTKAVVDPIRFQLLAPATILAGQQSVTVDVEQSEGHVQTFTAAGVAGEEIFLDRSPFLDGSAAITTAAGAWTEVTTFLSSGPNDRHFRVFADAQDRAMIRFGDGVRGAKPSGLVTINYKTGGGSEGNVEAEAIAVVQGSYTDAEGRAVQLTSSNALAASGGAPRESIESARAAIPASIRVTDRSVTREDFEINAQQVAGVARVAMVTLNEDAAVDENAGVIYVVPEGGGAPTQTLLDAVLEMVTVTRPHTITFLVEVLAAIYRPIDVWVKVTFAAGVSQTAARDEIRAALEAHFAVSLTDGTPNPAVDFGLNMPGQEVAWSDVFNVIRDLASVQKINASGLTLNGSAEDEALLVREFPTLGDVTVVDASTGQVV